MLGAYTQFAPADADMSMCHVLAKRKYEFMYVDNTNDYGHLINGDNFIVDNRLYPDMYSVTENLVDWERKYLHPLYYTYLRDKELPQPCPDVYDFPMMSPLWCKHMIETLEHYGKWSNGKNEVRIVFIKCA
jgi:hypothetical protein